MIARQDNCCLASDGSGLWFTKSSTSKLENFGKACINLENLFMFEIFTLLIASPAFLLATSQNSVLAANTVYGLPEIIRVGVSLVVLVA